MRIGGCCDALFSRHFPSSFNWYLISPLLFDFAPFQTSKTNHSIRSDCAVVDFRRIERFTFVLWMSTRRRSCFYDGIFTWNFHTWLTQIAFRPGDDSTKIFVDDFLMTGRRCDVSPDEGSIETSIHRWRSLISGLIKTESYRPIWP